MLTETKTIDLLFRPATARPELKDAPALVQSAMKPDGSTKDRVVTFADLESLIKQIAQHLEKLGVTKQDNVLMTAPNCPELAAAIIATWTVGAVAVPLDFRMTPQEVENCAKRMKAKVLMCSSKALPDFEKVFANLSFEGTKVTDLVQEFPKVAAETSQKSVDMDVPAFMILTSGTTGMPKAALHDLRSLMKNLAELGQLVDLGPTKSGLLPLPLSHIFGLEVCFSCLIYGSKVIFSDLSAQGFIGALRSHKASILVGVPTIYGAMLGLPDGVIDLSKAEVLLCGGAPLPPSLAADFIAKFGKRINNGYGSTESKIIALNLDGPVESVGKIVPSTRIETINSDGKTLEQGEEGEICICSDILMHGYYQQPDMTEAVLSKNCYKTGDVGYIKDGYLFISGREKEMIITAGNKVFPSEVENVLLTHPLAQEVAVLGVPHRQLGQVVKAVVVVKEGNESTLLDGDEAQRKEARTSLLSSFKEHCKQHLKRELRPLDYDFRSFKNKLPKTLSGKIDKKSLE